MVVCSWEQEGHRLAVPDAMVGMVSHTPMISSIQGLWHDSSTNEPLFSDIVEFDLSTVEPSLAGPRRPEDRVPLS